MGLETAMPTIKERFQIRGVTYCIITFKIGPSNFIDRFFKDGTEIDLHEYHKARVIAHDGMRGRP